MGNAGSAYSILVFPYLKTSRPTVLASVTLRSTDDTAGLPDEQAGSVREVAAMLFLQDDLRIKLASYAVVPRIDLDRYSQDLSLLENIQATIAYLYATPHEVFGDPLWSLEYASAIVFTPSRVSPSLVEPTGNVERIVDRPVPEKEGWTPGYDALFNFRHHFWVAKGSRVYGPLPNMMLNESQDLHGDIDRSLRASRHGLRSLLAMLENPQSPNSLRVLTAVRWFNDANREAMDESAALVSLAIAFESLLGLPRGEKTERLVDSIALLLGRVPRLDAWAGQFYDARSKIAHEGRADALDFVATDSRKGSADSASTYQSLLSYGRRVFRLCLSTLLVGADLARQAGLEDLLVTNQQRFTRICEVLADKTVATSSRLDQIKDDVDTLKRYRFLREGGLRLDTMLGAVRLAVQALIDVDDSMPEEDRVELQSRLAAAEAQDELIKLEAIDGMGVHLAGGSSGQATQHAATVRKLVEIVWGYVNMHYYWMKQHRESPAEESS